MTDRAQIDRLLSQLDREEDARPKRAAQTESRPDAVTDALRKVEESVNQVKRSRGEEAVELVSSEGAIEAATREEVERMARELDLDPAAVTATLGLRLLE